MDAASVFGGGNGNQWQLYRRTKSSHSFNIVKFSSLTSKFNDINFSKLSFSTTLSLRPHATSPVNNESNVSLPDFAASLDQVEQTYLMIKPDGVQRGLVGEIISRFERKGFKLIGLKLYKCSKDLAEEHYKELKYLSFFPKIIDYIISGPVVCMAWEGIDIVATARRLIGGTDRFQSEPGTIRGDFAIQIRGDLSIQKGRASSGHVGKNVIHGSHDPESGKREIALWFKEDELVQWEQAQAPWLGKCASF